MTSEELLNLILGDSARIAAAIETGAQWEVWMQVELAVLLSNAGLQVTREVHYPAPLNLLTLDILASDAEGHSYAIEMKAETGSQAGQAGRKPIMTVLESDVAKIKSFSIGSLRARWVVGIADSTTAKKRFAEYAAQYPGVVITGQSNVVAAIVIDANAL